MHEAMEREREKKKKGKKEKEREAARVEKKIIEHTPFLLV
jgi:hypothetical protein